MVSEKGAVNEDLVKERQKCTFNTLELTHLLDGGEAKTLERKERGKPKLIHLLSKLSSHGLLMER